MSRNATELAVSVVIPTHNPRMDYLARVLEALRQQTLAKSLWELVIVDNGSREALAGVRCQGTGVSKGDDSREEAQEGGTGNRKQEAGDRSAGPQGCGTSLPSHIPTFPPSTAQLDLVWHPHARVVREERVGLTNARLRGFAETSGEVIVLVDDDNVLAPDYLEQVVRIAREYPFFGTWSGALELELEPGSPGAGAGIAASFVRAEAKQRCLVE